ncbi:MAG: type VI secretion system protein TssA [Proteobacteria bacterium]|nr:type VI secretion system protein TssA [Pseudomonadota bacterium]
MIEVRELIDLDATPATVDLELLLAPLKGESRTGVSLRFEGTYDAIREARRADKAELPQGVWEREHKRADWSQVQTLCLDALQNRSKDIQIAVWLTEAWTKLDAFTGFCQGVELLAEMCDRYWDDLHPEIEDGDFDYRLGALIWANEHFPVLLRMLPITQPSTPDEIAYSWVDRDEARRLEMLAQKDKAAAKRVEGRKVTRAQFNTSSMLTPIEFYRDIIPQIGKAKAQVEALEGFLEACCGREAPSFSRIRAALDDISELAADLLREKGGEMPSKDKPDDAAAPEKAVKKADKPAPMHTPSPALDAGGPITNREQAYQQLSAAAAFLMASEPHSPVPYLVKRAVAWGGMGFGELLQELLSDGGDPKRLLRLLGIDQIAMGVPSQPENRPQPQGAPKEED